MKMGDRVRINPDLRMLIVDEELTALRDAGLVGVIEDVFEDGDLQVRFVDGSEFDAVHWFKPEELMQAEA